MITLTKLTRRSQESDILDELSKQVTACNEIISQWNDFVKTTQCGNEIKLKEMRFYTRYAKTKTELVDACSTINDYGIRLENDLQHAKETLAYVQTEEGKAEIAHLEESLNNERAMYHDIHSNIVQTANDAIHEFMGEDFSISRMCGYMMCISHYKNGDRGNFGEDIDLHLDGLWLCKENKERLLRANVGTCGSFELDSTMAERYIALGKLLQSEYLQEVLKNAILQVEELENAHRNNTKEPSRRLAELTFQK